MDVELLMEVREQVERSDFEDHCKRSFVLGWACMAVPEGGQSAKLLSECETYDQFIQAANLLISVASIGPTYSLAR